MRLLPRYYRDVLWSRDEGLPDVRSLSRDDLAELRAALPAMTEVVRRLHEAGVEIHVGTDVSHPFVVPGASLHEELRHLVDAGFTPEEAWAAATRVAGDWLNEPGLGVVREQAPRAASTTPSAWRWPAS
jgi:imidazolonepropionase-like amidohydrolase